MLFYLLFIFLSLGLLALGYYYPNKKKVLEWIVFILIVFIGGFRKKVGIDYGAYVNWYLHKTRDEDFEFGFVFIMNIFRKLNLDYTFLFFFFSFCTYLLVYLGIKKYTSNTSLALFFFILIPSLYLSSFTLIRQSFSVAISFYAFYYLLNKKYLIYTLLMLIGVSIHRTCLIPFVVFILVYMYVDRIKVTNLWFLMILSLILSKLKVIAFFGFIFENMRYSYYFSNRQEPVDLLKLIVLNLVAVFILLYFEKLKNIYPYQKYFLILYSCSIIFLNLLSEQSDLTRFYVYFRIFEIIVISDLLVLEKKKKRIFLFFFFLVLTLGTFLLALKKIPGYIPYNNVFINWTI